MSDALNLGWCENEARTKRRQFQQVLLVYLAIYAILGVVGVLFPGLLARLFGVEPPYGWLRGLGAMMLLAAALYLPGWQDPLRSKWPNLVGGIARFLLAIVWIVVGGGFLWLGLFELVSAIVLGLLLYSCFTAELQSRP